MKRDLELATRILLQIEAAPSMPRTVDIKVDGRADDEIAYHIRLLHSIGLVDAVDASDMGRIHWFAMDLTWKGHDFLDEARKPKWLEMVKEKGIEKGVDAAFAAIAMALGYVLKTQS